jgi:hypothetical protein
MNYFYSEFKERYPQYKIGFYESCEQELKEVLLWGEMRGYTLCVFVHMRAYPTVSRPS